ncbi:MAG: hypothetical protein R6X19_05700 [Kiritimatiellia bacterium]
MQYRTLISRVMWRAVFQPHYQRLTGAAHLRGHKVGLGSPVDIQKMLPTGDKAFIESEAKRMVETFQGGLMVKTDPDLKGIGVKPEWDQWGYDALGKAAGLA